MRTIRLKVCGMRDRSNILDVAALKPDYMGFIYYPGSKRFVGNDFVVPEELPSAIRRVGVFVNQTVDHILRLALNDKLDFVQLHGSESAGQCRAIRKAGIGVIKAFNIDPSFDFHEVTPYRDVADYFLFDAKGDGFGGTGVTFDWNRLAQYDQPVPFFLSGGISPELVAEVKKVRASALYAIDVNSKVEKEIGVKDVARIRNIRNLTTN